MDPVARVPTNRLMLNNNPTGPKNPTSSAKITTPENLGSGKQTIARSKVGGDLKPKSKTEKIRNLVQKRSPTDIITSPLVSPTAVTLAELGELRQENERLKTQLVNCQTDHVKLKDGYNTLKDECAALKKKEGDLESAVQILEQNSTTTQQNHQSNLIEISSFRDKEIAVQLQLQQLEQANAQLHDKIEELKQTVQTQEKKVVDAQKAKSEVIRTTKVENEALKSKCQRIAGELASYLTETSTFADDDYFRGEWKALGSLIADWAQNNFRGTPRHSSQEKSSSGRHYFLYLAQDPQSYLSHKNYRPYFVQSFVWVTLMEQVFAYPGSKREKGLFGLYWAHCRRDEIESLLRYLRPEGPPHTVPVDEMRAYLKWRAATTRVLLSKTNTNPDEEVKVYDYLLEKLALKISLPLASYRCNNDEVNFKNQLVLILRRAIRLDAKIYQQWARIVPMNTLQPSSNSYEYGFQFDDRIMDELDGRVAPSQEGYVELVVVPALVRYGTMTGEDYQTPVVIDKAKVHAYQVVRRSTGEGIEFQEEDGGNGSFHKLWNRIVN